MSAHEQSDLELTSDMLAYDKKLRDQYDTQLQNMKAVMQSLTAEEFKEMQDKIRKADFGLAALDGLRILQRNHHFQERRHRLRLLRVWYGIIAGVLSGLSLLDWETVLGAVILSSMAAAIAAGVTDLVIEWLNGQDR